MMNPQIKQEWLDELKLHKQTQSRLRDGEGGGHCCLGVLCEVASRHNVGHWIGPEIFCATGFHPEGIDWDYRETSDDGGSSRVELPDPIEEWCGLPSSVGTIYDYKDRRDTYLSLVDMNDCGCTFDQIADVIKYFF